MKPTDFLSTPQLQLIIESLRFRANVYKSIISESNYFGLKEYNEAKEKLAMIEEMNKTFNDELIARTNG